MWDLNRLAPAADGLDTLARQLLRQESVGSSRIEDLVIGQRRLACAAAGGGDGKGDATARLILGNVRAMERASALAVEPRPFTRDDIVAIHRTLFEGTRDDALAGVVREEQTWIGGSAYSPAGAAFVPPPPEHVETIHPFLDGNGWAGRCLIHVVFRRRDLARTVVPPISFVLATHRDLYIDGLEAYRFGELKDWLLPFAGATVKAVDSAHELAARVAALREDWLERLGHPRGHASSRALLDQLAAEPVLTVARAAELAGVSETAAARALAALERAGILTPSQQRWGRRWEARELFDLLDAFERGVATPGDTSRPARPAPRGTSRPA